MDGTFVLNLNVSLRTSGGNGSPTRELINSLYDEMFLRPCRGKNVRIARICVMDERGNVHDCVDIRPEDWTDIQTGSELETGIRVSKTFRASRDVVVNRLAVFNSENRLMFVTPTATRILLSGHTYTIAWSLIVAASFKATIKAASNVYEFRVDPYWLNRGLLNVVIRRIAGLPDGRVLCLSHIDYYDKGWVIVNPLLATSREDRRAWHDPVNLTGNNDLYAIGVLAAGYTRLFVLWPDSPIRLNRNDRIASSFSFTIS
ncbi:MAG: hypothetical protein C4294_17145 [Nitrospiraceae bacterium]